MKINVKKVLIVDAVKKSKPAPIPKVRLKPIFEQATDNTPGLVKPIYDHAGKPKETVRKVEPIIGKESISPDTSKKDALLQELWAQMMPIKKQRDIISTRTAHLVEEIAERLRKDEGPLAAEEFLLGNIAMHELTDQYGKIIAKTDEAIELYDKIKHVEQYGEFPNIEPTDTGVIDALKYERTRLKDLIHKLGKKIRTGVAKNPSRISRWKEELAQAEARRDDVNRKIKRIQYEARG